ncbi:MAG: hypothetical protein K0S47_1654 [Herbinix sp.]|jgi:predicted RNA-binding protein associated with RNAse of E/G family|nr:hypothetical protein [Herbinix sp.]
MSDLHIYRRRFIPEELVHLKDDIIIKHDNNLMITMWSALHPRKDIAKGVSAYYMDLGIKVSKVYNSLGDIVYWYCDIIHTKKLPDDQNTIVFEDLLVDVILYENGSIKVMDLDELAEAFDQKKITESTIKDALRTLDTLLRIIYQGKFGILMDPINNAEADYYSSSNI